MYDKINEVAIDYFVSVIIEKKQVPMKEKIFVFM